MQRSHNTYHAIRLTSMVQGHEKNCNWNLYIKIKIDKAYRTTSNDALCILTGNAPVELKTEEAANIYRITKDRQNQLLDHETDHQDWTHPADTLRITEQNETTEHTIYIYRLFHDMWTLLQEVIS